MGTTQRNIYNMWMWDGTDNETYYAMSKLFLYINANDKAKNVARFRAETIWAGEGTIMLPLVEIWNTF